MSFYPQPALEGHLVHVPSPLSSLSTRMPVRAQAGSGPGPRECDGFGTACTCTRKCMCLIPEELQHLWQSHPPSLLCLSLPSQIQHTTVGSRRFSPKGRVLCKMEGTG